MELSQSNDSGYNFDRLTQVDLIFFVFWSLFLIDFFKKIS
jgi:hypothetical protein